MWQQLKAFLLRGDVIALAVAVVIAGAFQKSVDSLTYATGALNENLRTVKDELSSFRSEVTSRFSGLHEHLELGRKDLDERASHLDDRLDRLDGALNERFDRLEKQLLR